MHLCAQIGKSRSYLSEMLANNRDIPEKMIKPVADALGVTVEELTGEEQKEKLSTAGDIDLSGLSPDDAELVRKIMAASA